MESEHAPWSLDETGASGKVGIQADSERDKVVL